MTGSLVIAILPECPDHRFGVPIGGQPVSRAGLRVMP